MIDFPPKPNRFFLTINLRKASPQASLHTGYVGMGIGISNGIGISTGKGKGISKSRL